MSFFVRSDNCLCNIAFTLSLRASIFNYIWWEFFFHVVHFMNPRAALSTRSFYHQTKKNSIENDMLSIEPNWIIVVKNWTNKHLYICIKMDKFRKCTVWSYHKTTRSKIQCSLRVGIFLDSCRRSFFMSIQW